MTEKGKERAIRLLLDYRKKMMEFAVDPSIYDDKKIEFPRVWVVGDSVSITINAALRSQRNQDFMTDGKQIYDFKYVTAHPIEEMTWQQAFLLRHHRKPTKKDMENVDRTVRQIGQLMSYEKYLKDVPHYQRISYLTKKYN